MCDNCPSTACSPATPKAARRAKHQGNPKVRISRDDVAALRSYARAGWTDAEALHHVLWTVGMAEAHKAEAARLTRERDDATRERDAERATTEAYSELLRQSEEAARKLAEERNALTARLARFDTLSASINCDTTKGGSGYTAELPGYPEVRATDASPVVARLEVAVQAANYLPGLVAAAMRERDTARTAAEEAGAKLADERQAHAATAAALAACNARVETLTVSLKIADNRCANQASSLADAARRIQAQMEALEQRDERLTSQTWTIDALAISTLIALLGLALVVA